MFKNTWATHSDQQKQRQHDGLLQNSERFNDFFLKPRNTMRQIAATRLHYCCDKALRLFGRSDMSQKLKPVWIRATDHSDKILSQGQWFSHISRGDLLQKPVAATRRSNLSHRVSRP